MQIIQQPTKGRSKPAVIYMSTSNLETAVEILLNAGCIRRLTDAEAHARERLEHLFRITIESE